MTEVYETSAYTNEQRWHSFYKRIYRRMREHLPTNLNKAAVLDWGCETGEILFRLLHENEGIKTAVGFDRSRNNLSVARDKMKLLDPKKQKSVSLTRTPPKSGTYNLLICVHMLRYMKNPHHTLSELGAQTKKEGYIVLADLSKKSQLPKHLGWYLRKTDPHANRYFLSHEARVLLEDAGFSITHEESFRVNLLWEAFLIIGTKKTH